MANAFIQGANAGLNKARDDRQAKQVELSNYIKGYERDATGKYVPNQRGKRQLDTQDEAMNQKLMVLQAQNEAIISTQNTADMTNATTKIAMGKPNEAWRIVNKNPILKQKLLENFGVANIVPIDWANDRELFAGSGVDISDEVLSKPEVRNALNSSFFKIIGPDGKAKLGNTQHLIDSTGYMQYASEEDRNGIGARINKITEILSGHVKTPKERAIEANNRDTALINSSIAKDMTSLKEEYYDTILEDTTLSAEEKLIKIQEIKGTAKEDLEKQLKEQKLAKAKIDAEVAEATKDDKITKAEAEALTAKQKAEASKPVVGEAEFIKAIRDQEKVPFNDDNLRTARRIQGKRTLTSERSKEVNGRFSMAKSFHNFTNKFIKADLNRNSLAKIGTTLDKLIKPGMTGQEQQKVLNNIELDTELRALVSEYVKFMSGAAVTTEEFNRYNDITQGGVWSSRESATEALRSFTNYLRTSSKDRVESLTDLPYDYLVKREDYYNWAKENPEITREISRRNATKIDETKKSIFDKYSGGMD